MDRIFKRVIIPKGVLLSSNKSHIHYYSFAEFIENEIFKEKNSESPIYLSFYVKKPEFRLNDLKSSTESYRKYSDSIYLKPSEGELSVYFVKKIYPLGTLLASIKLRDNYKSGCLEVNKLYYSLFKMKIENVVPPGILLKDITYMMLTHNGFLPMHSSAFAKNKKEGYLIMAPPNVGKTTTVMGALKRGFYALAEDISVLSADDLCIHAVPYTATHHHENSPRKYLGPLSYFVTGSITPFGVEFKDRLLEMARLRGIFLLEHGAPEIQELKAEESRRRILLLNRDEFKYTANIIMTAIQYYTLEIDIRGSEISLLNRLLFDNDIPVYLVRAKSPFDYITLIGEVI